MIWGQIRIVGPDGTLTPQGIQMLQSLETTSSGSVAWVDVTGKPATFPPAVHTHPQSDVTNLVTDLSGKQSTLVSGTNIKTVNGTSLLGSGDVVIATSLRGAATITVPNGAIAYTGTITATGVLPAMDVMLTLGGDTAENTAELLDIAAMSGTAGTDQIAVAVAFSAPVSGDIKLNWSAA